MRYRYLKEGEIKTWETECKRGTPGHPCWQPTGMIGERVSQWEAKAKSYRCSMGGVSKIKTDAEIKRLRDALHVAYSHIISHHDVAKMSKLQSGGFCPICHHKDGTEPEMNQIVKALRM